MPKFLVKYDATRYDEESYEDEDGETVYEDYVDEYTDETTVVADDEDMARAIVTDQLYSYDDVTIWSVEPVD